MNAWLAAEQGFWCQGDFDDTMDTWLEVKQHHENLRGMFWGILKSLIQISFVILVLSLEGYALKNELYYLTLHASC